MIVRTKMYRYDYLIERDGSNEIKILDMTGKYRGSMEMRSDNPLHGYILDVDGYHLGFCKNLQAVGRKLEAFWYDHPNYMGEQNG